MNDIDEWARNHHGLITRAASGLSRFGAGHGPIRSGRLIAVHPGVARLPGTADTAEQRIAAAVLAAAPAAIASHRSATYLWGIPRLADAIPSTSSHPDARRSVTCAACRHHRPTDHLHLDAATTVRHPVHQHLAHHVRPRRRRPPRGVGRCRPRPDARVWRTLAALETDADRPFAPGSVGRHRPARRRSTTGRSTVVPPIRCSSPRCAGWSAGISSTRRVPSRHRRARGRFPLRRHAGDPRVRRLDVPRLAARAVRTGPFAATPC